MSNLQERLKRLHDTIAETCTKVNRPLSSVQLIVVTKTASLEAIQEIIRLGCTELGENRVQHLKQIAEQIDEFLKSQPPENNLPKTVNWHMIGHLQRNKVKPTVQLCRMIHSVDTLRLAEEINIAAYQQGIHMDVLLQVNCSGEPQKYGVPPGAAIHMAEQIATMPNLRLCGLMTMAPLTMDKDRIRACFAHCRELFQEIRAEKIVGSRFKHLSMGMSQDYQIAIEEGATMVRIGSALFA